MIKNRQRPSLKDVAALAGTSVATASRVLNNSGYIGEDTRSKVLKAAELLNYQPNLQAKGLRRGSSRTVGLLIPNLLNMYYTYLADSISQMLTDNGYQLLLSSTRDDPEIEQDTLLKMIGHDVDGLIWVPTAGTTRLLDDLRTQKVPAVSIVRRVSDDALDTIVFEDFSGSRAATRHLLSLGHRRIAFIGGDINYSSNRERWEGFLSMMDESGVPVDEKLVKLGAVRSLWGSLAITELLSLAPPPTAIFIASNAIMPGVMKALRQNGVAIPEQISLICFDDLEWFAYFNPPISAVATSHERLAEAAVNLLMRRIQEPFDPERPPLLMKVSFELMIRSSTIPPIDQNQA